MEDKQLFTIIAFTENQVGLLNQLSIIFTRRCLNIESLSASPSSIKGVHKFIFTCYSDREMMTRVVEQMEKRIDVIRAFFFTDDEVVYEEVALYKVPTLRLLSDTKVEDIIRRHNARIMEITHSYTVIEKTGHGDELEALFEELEQYDISQFVRSGRIAVTKSSKELVTLFLEEQQRRKEGMK